MIKALHIKASLLAMGLVVACIGGCDPWNLPPGFCGDLPGCIEEVCFRGCPDGNTVPCDDYCSAPGPYQCPDDGPQVLDQTYCPPE